MLTVVHEKAKLLNHSQVSGHSVDAVSFQPCNTEPIGTSTFSSHVLNICVVSGDTLHGLS